jgi:hypothetical protein
LLEIYDHGTLFPHSGHNGGHRENIFRERFNQFCLYHFRPPSLGKLKKARKKRLKEMKMNAALKEIFAFFVFLILLMDVAQYHRDPNTFLLTKTLYENFEALDAFGLDLSAVG